MKSGTQIFAKQAFALALAIACTIGFTATASAQEATEFDALTSELYTARHDGGYYRPYPPRPPRHRTVECRAVNQRGTPFYGRGPNVPSARDAALDYCYRYSRRCYMDGCYPI